MCELYSAIPPSEYECLTRSVRLNGAVTSLRLERRFWSILADLAEGEQVTLGKMLSTLHQEAVFKHGHVENFASLLRVVCTTYLAREPVGVRNACREKTAPVSSVAVV